MTMDVCGGIISGKKQEMRMTYIDTNQRAQNNGRIAKIIVRLVIVGMILGALIYCALGYRKYEAKRSRRAGLDIPAYSGVPYAIINNDRPFVEDSDLSTVSFSRYSELDGLGRCGVAFANVSRELMPTVERGQMGNIKPTGWVQGKYPGIVQSSPPYLYNRCHLKEYCLTGENTNEKNLITGTRYMNVEGMLQFEETVARYLDENDNHVLYRVTPVFEGDNLLADGVLMEAYSVEDGGRGICFCVFCYNVQPGISIDYKTGENWEE